MLAVVAVVAIVVALINLALVVFLVVTMQREREAHAKQLAGMALEWAEERSELLERIQRPERIPARIRGPRRETDKDKPKDLRQRAQVGRVVPGPSPDGEGD